MRERACYRWVLLGTRMLAIAAYFAPTAGYAQNVVGPIGVYGHAGGVEAVAYSPTGDRVLIGGTQAVLVERTTGTVLARFLGHTHGVFGVAFSPDGTQVLTASGDQTARLWDADTGAPIRTFTGHSGGLLAAEFSPDGGTVATGSADGTVRLWDTASGQVIRTIAGHPSPIMDVAFSPDGDQIATVTHNPDNRARVWDADTGELVQTFSGHTDAVLDVAYMPNGTQILTASWDTSARIWDIATGETAHTLSGHHTSSLTSVAVSPDGTRAVTGSFENRARVWNATTGQHLGALEGHVNRITAVAFSPDGTEVLTGAYDGAAIEWNVSTRNAVTAYGSYLGLITALSVRPDGGRIATVSADNRLRTWAVDTGALDTIFQPHILTPWSLDYSPDGDYLLTGSQDGTAMLWEAATQTGVRTLNVQPNHVGAVAHSAEDFLAVIGQSDGVAVLWDMLSSIEVRSFEGHTGWIYSVAFSPNDSQVATGSADGTAKVWDTNDGDLLYTFSGHSGGWVTAVDFSPDGNVLLTAGGDSSAKLWDLTSGSSEPVQSFTGHSAGLWTARFSPDGTRIVTGSVDNSARLWDAATGQPIRTYSGHRAAVRAAAFSPDGNHVFTGSEDLAVLQWPADVDTPIVSVLPPSHVITAEGPVTFDIEYTAAVEVTLASGDIALDTTGTAAGTPSVSGVGNQLRTVTVSNINGDGTLAIALAAGTAKDGQDNLAAAAGPSATVIVDNTAPAIDVSAPSLALTNNAPVSFTVNYADLNGIAGITLNPDDIGIVATGTADADAAVTGSGLANRTVTLNNVRGDGTLAISIAANTATDAAGNPAEPVAASAAFEVDNTPPDDPDVAGPAVVNFNQPTWTWTSGGGGAGVYRYGWAPGDWLATDDSATHFEAVAPLDDGVHTLFVQERDAAGNWSDAGFFSILVDTVPPAAPEVTGPALTNQNQPAWLWASSGGGAGRYRYGWAEGEWLAPDAAVTAFVPSPPLGNGAYTLFVQERDDAGNWSASGMHTITVDTTPPAPPIVGGPALTYLAQPTWTWTSGGGGEGLFRYGWTEGAWLEIEAAQTGFAPDSPLTDGAHTLFVQERDAAGNWSFSGSHTIEVDTVPPNPPVITTDGGEGPGMDFATTAFDVVLEGTTDADTHALEVNGSTAGVTYTPGSTAWSFTADLAFGENTFDVTAADEAGSVSEPATITVFRLPLEALYVATDGSDSTGDGTLENPWHTIGHAMAEAAPFATAGRPLTIQAGPGLYEEQVTYLPHVRLAGAGAGSTIVRPSGFGGGQRVVVVMADDTVLADLTVSLPDALGDTATLVRIDGVEGHIERAEINGEQNLFSIGVIVQGAGSSPGAVRDSRIHRVQYGIQAVDTNINITRNEFGDIRNDAIFIERPAGKSGHTSETPLLGSVDETETSGFNVFRQINGQAVANFSDVDTIAQHNDWGVYTEGEIAARVTGSVQFDPWLGKAIVPGTLVVELRDTQSQLAIPDSRNPAVWLLASEVLPERDGVSGLFIFPALPPGSYTVVAGALGYAESSRGVTVGGTGTVPLTLHLSETGAPPGDVNGDFAIDAQDIQLVVNAVLNIDIDGLDPDVNGDGAVDALDVQHVINLVLAAAVD